MIRALLAIAALAVAVTGCSSTLSPSEKLRRQELHMKQSQQPAIGTLPMGK
jgi:hypothetical protein